MPAAAVVLTCARDVEQRDGRFHALTAEPWLALAPHPALRPGRFVEIVYRLGAWDEPVRPVFRFIGTGGVLAEAIGAGPVAGAAAWIGPIPAGTNRVEVSPTCRAGPFDFTIESIRPRRLPALLRRGLRQARRQAVSAILTRLIGLVPESDTNLRWAVGFTPMSDWPRWQAVYARALDLTGRDRARSDWDEGPRFDIVIVGHANLGRTRASLAAQIYPQGRIKVAPAGGGAPAAAADFVFALNAGETLRPEALATIAETSARHRDARLIYTDEAQVDAAGRPGPCFKPGWSPVLFAGRPDLGRAVFVRRDLWARFGPAEQAAFIAEARLPPALIAGLAPGEARRVPRVLLSDVVARPALPTPMRSPAVRAAGLRATIVIPTRDRADLLARCLAALRAASHATTADIVIVDNGSVGRPMADLLRTLSEHPAVTVLKRPGAFNFAALCNAAAAASTADVFVFLNDDTMVRSGDWLDRLVAQAIKPEVGAVGAKLLYPDGRVQHVGVVVGLGGHAGHFGAGLPGDAPGWAGRHLCVHEVAAVTGACLAVERRKFDAVGGFDAEHLPVELNDVDLCLRLAERGWRARVDPAVEIVHAESASRGRATFRRSHVYAAERAYFAARWCQLMRDDPFFHPGLSLFHLDAALG